MSAGNPKLANRIKGQAYAIRALAHFIGCRQAGTFSHRITRPFIDLTAAYAIQARAYLYAGMWKEAVTAATNVINRRPLVNLDQAAFSGRYNQTNSGEIIWNVQFESGQSGPTFLVYFATVQRSYFRPALEIADTTEVV